MTGNEFVQEVKSSRPWRDHAITRVTTDNSTEKVMRMGQLGCDGYICKPFTGLRFEGGGCDGVCAAAAEESTARALAAVLLGDSVESPRAEAWEVVCGFANRFCGRFLGQADGQLSCRISPPLSLAPGGTGLMRPLHKRVVLTTPGKLLFVVVMDTDKLGKPATGSQPWNPSK